jgi:hypothetical protein
MGSRRRQKRPDYCKCPIARFKGFHWPSKDKVYKQVKVTAYFRIEYLAKAPRQLKNAKDCFYSVPVVP